MRLALGTSLFSLALGVRAAPQAVRPGQAIALNVPSERPLGSLCASAPEGSTQTWYCLALRKREEKPPTTSAMPVHTATNLPSNNQLRTIGIVGGFLAGVALVSIIGIVLILVRNQRRARSSAASGSTRSRSRTHSRAQQPPVLMTQETSGSTFPIIRVPPPRIYTGARAPTTISGDGTNATAGHPTDLLQFPVSPGQGSASSRTTSFGHHSESGGSGPPRRPPQLPSLGLSQARPFLRSVASAFSYHASAGHSSPVTQEVEVEVEPDTSVTHGATTSLSGSRTAVTTEDMTRTAPVEVSSEHSGKPSSH
ncbi:hypothetical protein RhiJN_00757 [Ceratobasidium sp. AG-Ba]|nr:hypothetical protein RhiJN_00757 [Ceratobasidium sp. AG-Ba]